VSLANALMRFQLDSRVASLAEDLPGRRNQVPAFQFGEGASRLAAVHRAYSRVDTETRSYFGSKNGARPGEDPRQRYRDSDELTALNPLSPESLRDALGTLSADDVVAAIVGDGGRAVASYDSVATRSGGQAIVDRAMDAFGRLDIVINNAGILRNARFELLTDEQIDAVIDTHLKALFYVSQPAYRVMIKQGYGRFVFTSSGAGMFGNGWQANYGAAKAATTGLMQVLAIEGRRHGIVANAVIPGAITRLNDDVDPELLAEAARLAAPLMGRMTPEYVAPLVLYLASEQCRTSQTLYSAVGGRFALVFPGITRGWTGPVDRPALPEEVAANFAEVEDITHFIRSRGTLDDLPEIRKAYEEALRERETG
jgi:NAD(P)-dependent dehydrogenase (short-subunit alcohol dehydrogenase family)